MLALLQQVHGEEAERQRQSGIGERGPSREGDLRARQAILSDQCAWKSTLVHGSSLP